MRMNMVGYGYSIIPSLPQIELYYGMYANLITFIISFILLLTVFYVTKKINLNSIVLGYLISVSTFFYIYIYRSAIVWLTNHNFLFINLIINIAFPIILGFIFKKYTTQQNKKAPQ